MLQRGAHNVLEAAEALALNGRVAVRALAARQLHVQLWRKLCAQRAVPVLCAVARAEHERVQALALQDGAHARKAHGGVNDHRLHAQQPQRAAQRGVLPLAAHPQAHLAALLQAQALQHAQRVGRHLPVHLRHGEAHVLAHSVHGHGNVLGGLLREHAPIVQRGKGLRAEVHACARGGERGWGAGAAGAAGRAV